MTHQIGTGTVNIAVNVPRDERDLLGKLATRLGMSIGALLRLLALRGLEAYDPSEAERLHQVRSQYYGALMLAVFVCALLCNEGMDLRRAGRSVRRPRVEERTEV